MKAPGRLGYNGASGLSMLILTRRIGETVTVGQNITVTVLG